MAITDITGFELMVTVTLAVPVQPAAVPVTVYVVVAAGVTETGVPFKLPGIQVKLVPTILLIALIEADSPMQIEAGMAVGVITGL